MSFMLRSFATVVLLHLAAMGFAQHRTGNGKFLKHGFHAGLGVTSAFDRFQLSAENIIDQHVEQRNDLSVTLLGNAFVGYGYTVGRRLFIGAEAGVYLPQRKGVVQREGVVFTGNQYTDHLSVQDLVTTDLLLGFRLIDNTLFYVRGGGSLARIHLSQDPTPSIPDSAFSDSAFKTGARVGLGLYYSLTDRFGIALDHVITLYQEHTPLWQKYNLRFNEKVTSNYISLTAILQFRTS